MVNVNGLRGKCVLAAGSPFSRGIVTLYPVALQRGNDQHSRTKEEGSVYLLSSVDV